MALTPMKRFTVLQRDGFVCRYCGAHPPSVDLEVDHIVPRKAGGSDDTENLITACSQCNRGKRATLLHGIEEERAKGPGRVDPHWDVTDSLIRLHEILYPWVWSAAAEAGLSADMLESLRIRLIEAEDSILAHGLVANDSPWREHMEEYRLNEQRMADQIKRMEQERTP